MYYQECASKLRIGIPELPIPLSSFKGEGMSSKKCNTLISSNSDDDTSDEDISRRSKRKRRSRKHESGRSSSSESEDSDEPRYVLNSSSSSKRKKSKTPKTTKQKRTGKSGGLDLQKLFMAAIIARANQSKRTIKRTKKNRRNKTKSARMEESDNSDSKDNSDACSSNGSDDDSSSCMDDGTDNTDEDYAPPPKRKSKRIKRSTRVVQRRLVRALLPLRGGVLADDEEAYIKTLSTAQAKDLLAQAKMVASRANRAVPLTCRVLKWPCKAQTKAMICERITNLEDMEPGEGEYAKLSTWLQNVDALPIGIHTTLPVNVTEDPPEKVAGFLKTAQNTLDAAVHGHDVAKKEIVRLCAQWISNPNAPTQALAIQGPMGNGKTTLVKRGIAKVMNRPFVFIALGGAQDSAFLSGHDYTYEGARAGRIAMAVKTAGCMDPVIFLDELDKLSDTPQGREIQHTLLHLLDSSQNSHFRDKYFDGIDLDMSRALFVVSFNDPSKIDRILLDRMRVVVTRGFGVGDKLKIARDFMIPNIISDFKLSAEDIEITDDALRCVIQNYTDEKGVRCLRRCIHQICAEANLQRLLGLNKAPSKTIVNETSVGAYVKSLRPQGKNCSLAMYS